MNSHSATGAANNAAMTLQGEFAESGGVTTMRITQEFDSKDARDGAVESGMEKCMEAGFQQLDAMLSRST